jgi:acyl-CoA dehydrogenase
MTVLQPRRRKSDHGVGLLDRAGQEQLDWMRAFVREEIWPLETIVDELDQDGLDRIYASLREEVKRRGVWAAHLPPDLGGQGFGQVKLELTHEILGSSPFAPTRSAARRRARATRRSSRAPASPSGVDSPFGPRLSASRSTLHAPHDPG